MFNSIIFNNVDDVTFTNGLFSKQKEKPVNTSPALPSTSYIKFQTPHHIIFSYYQFVWSTDVCYNKLNANFSLLFDKNFKYKIYDKPKQCEISKEGFEDYWNLFYQIFRESGTVNKYFKVHNFTINENHTIHTLGKFSVFDVTYQLEQTFYDPTTESWKLYSIDRRDSITIINGSYQIDSIYENILSKKFIQDVKEMGKHRVKFIYL
jgi:hypothetical protein